MTDLAIVRRLEAMAFRAWPASSVHYNGSWQIRQTAGHPSKRLNSINPLDPSDHKNIEERIESAAKCFSAYNRPLVFRQSPLASPQLDSFLDARGWIRFDDSIVFMADISQINLDDAIDMLPIKDIGWYVDAAVKIQERDGLFKAGLTEVISSIRQKNGLFVIESNQKNRGENNKKEVISSVLCVTDNEFCGILDLGTHKKFHRQGYARGILKSALLWARYNGVKKAWLQVEKNNIAAIKLYESLGFWDVYRYSYRKQLEHSS